MKLLEKSEVVRCVGKGATDKTKTATSLLGHVLHGRGVDVGETTVLLRKASTAMTNIDGAWGRGGGKVGVGFKCCMPAL